MSHSQLVQNIKKAKLFNCNDISNFLDTIVTTQQNKGGIPQVFLCELGKDIFITKLCLYRLSVPELNTDNTQIINQSEAEIRCLQALQEPLKKRYFNGVIKLLYIHTCDD